MKRERPEKQWQWLQSNPGLNELRARYPQQWDAVERELAGIFERRKPEELQAYLDRSPVQGVISERSPARRGSVDSNTREAIVEQAIKSRMAQLVVRKCCLSVAAGVTKGKVRFNLFNGLIAQKLLFARGFERKPVALAWFRLLWPMLWQKRLLMPLVQPKGIYCFYSRPLVEALAKMIGAASCLEIAAGDGTLARFLKDRGVNLTASDNYAWNHAVHYPEWVLRLDARESLRQSAPEVVICSWPPANNDFEHQVFKTPSVRLYIVIGSRHRFASGNWQAYGEQSAFSFEQDTRLGRLVLPPELEPAVYVFRRKTGETT